MGLFSRHDYLEKGDVLTSLEIVEALFYSLGKPIHAPNGAEFTFDHIRTLMPDVDANVLTLPEVKDFDYEYCRLTQNFNWKKEVGDCDNITKMYGVDMGRGARKNKWVRGKAVIDLAYLSHSLGDVVQDGFWAGYHSAPAIIYKFAPSTYRVIVRQPPQLDYLGAWQNSEDEVREWVCAEGLF